MAMVFFDGADYYATADIEKKWTTNVGAEISAGAGRRGGGALALSNGDLLTKNFTAESEIIFGFAYRPNPAGTEGNVCHLHNSGVLHITLTTTNEGRLNAYLDGFGLLGSSDPVAAMLGDEFVYIEGKVVIHRTTGSITLRVTDPSDGNITDSAQTVLTLTGIRTKIADVAGSGTVDSFSVSGLTSGVLVDDTYLCSTSGTLNNDFLGDSQVVTLRPRIDGQYSQFVRSESGAHSTLVGTATASTSAYVSGTAALQKDTFRLQYLLPVVGVIHRVSVHTYLEAEPYTSAQGVEPMVRNAAELEYYALSQLVPDSPAYISAHYDTNPTNPGVEWTQEDIYALEFGIRVYAPTIRFYHMAVELIRFNGVSGTYSDSDVNPDGSVSDNIWGVRGFLESPRFNTAIRYGMSGGPEYETSIVSTVANYEQRNANYPSPRCSWQLATDLYTRAEADDLIAFFRERMGQLGGFRLKDWTDWNCTKEDGVLEITPNGFQLRKKYTNGENSVYRDIIKPVEGTLRFYRDDVEIIAANVDYTNGIVTLAPGEGDLSWSGEFDVPSRFSVDRFNIDFSAYRESDGESLFAVSGLSAIELRRYDLGGSSVFKLGIAAGSGGGGGGGAQGWDGSSGRSADGFGSGGGGGGGGGGGLSYINGITSYYLIGMAQASLDDFVNVPVPEGSCIGPPVVFDLPLEHFITVYHNGYIRYPVSVFDTPGQILLAYGITEVEFKGTDTWSVPISAGFVAPYTEDTERVLLWNESGGYCYFGAHIPGAPTALRSLWEAYTISHSPEDYDAFMEILMGTNPPGQTYHAHGACCFKVHQPYGLDGPSGGDSLTFIERDELEAVPADAFGNRIVITYGTT